MPLAPAVATQLTTPDTTRTMSLFIGGRDCTPIADLPTSSIQDNAGHDPAQAELSLWIALTSAPEVYDQALVRMVDHVANAEAWRGYVTSRHPITGLEPILEVRADDAGTLLDDIWIDAEYRRPESMQARIAYFWGKYAGSHLNPDMSKVDAIGGTLPGQRYAVVTLRQVIEMVLAQASSAADYRVDHLARLHVYTTETDVAPYDVIVGTPGGGQFAPEDLDIDYDAKQYFNRVFVQGATPAASTFRSDGAAIAAANGLVRTAMLQAPEATTLAQARAVGDLALARQKAAVARGRFTASSTYDGWRAGQMLNVTEPDHGLSASPFQIKSVKTTFEPTKTGIRRKYGVEFGGRQAALSGDGQAPLIAGATGSVYLLDQLGNSMISNAAEASAGGIGPAVRRYIQSGVYNGDFFAPPPGPDAPIDDTTNPLPYWSFVQVSGTSTIAVSVVDTGQGSGRRLSFQMAAGSAGDEAYIEQIVPVNSARGQNWVDSPRVTILTDAAVNSMEAGISMQYLKNDGVTTTGTATSSYSTTTSIGASSLSDKGGVPNGGVLPADAYFVRIRIGFRRGAEANGSSGSVNFTEARTVRGPDALRIPDFTDPTTYSYARLLQSNGQLDIIADINSFPVGQIRINTTGSENTVDFSLNGSRLKFYPQGCRASRSTTLTGIVSSTWTAIPMNATEEWDPFGFHDLATNPSRFTVPTGWDGTYLLMGHTVGSSAMTGRILCGWGINGANPTNDMKNDYNQAAVAGTIGLECSALVELLAGDFVEFMIFHTTGSNQSSGSPHWASITYMGQMV